MLGAKAARYFYSLFYISRRRRVLFLAAVFVFREEVKPGMGRKKSNARIQPHGKRIHVNKYINKRGCTKRKSAAAYNRSIEKQQEISQKAVVNYDSLPAYHWPTTRIPKQYEIWFAELGDHYGTSVQSGNRPVLILTNDVANRYSQTFTVIPLTSKMKKLDLPTHIVLTEAHCEMLKPERLEDSVLLIEQITTIDQSALFNRLCRVTSAEKKQEIEQAVARQFDMRNAKKNKQNTDKNTAPKCGSSNTAHSRKEV